MNYEPFIIIFNLIENIQFNLFVFNKLTLKNIDWRRWEGEPSVSGHHLCNILLQKIVQTYLAFFQHFSNTSFLYFLGHQLIKRCKGFENLIKKVWKDDSNQFVGNKIKAKKLSSCFTKILKTWTKIWFNPTYMYHGRGSYMGLGTKICFNYQTIYNFFEKAETKLKKCAIALTKIYRAPCRT